MRRSLFYFGRLRNLGFDLRRGSRFEERLREGINDLLIEINEDEFQIFDT
jgi:hypothetical protein